MIVGGGGREHALAWKIMQDDPSSELIAAPGNPGIAALARCVSVSATDTAALLDLARAERPDLTVIGPEAPLAAGVVDRFVADGFPVFGPTAAAAEIETSKAFAKALMVEAGVPTARAERHTDPGLARRAARRLGHPLVIKASGLAAGKGVVVCGSSEEADRAIDDMLVRRAYGSAGAEILVEEFMEGEELSVFAVVDGRDARPMLPAQDHKRLLDGDRGPNTGGMGAYAPVSIGTDALVRQVQDTIILPTLDALRARGRSFTGLLYAGLMITPEGPKVVEFNCRFGDPETEALVPLLRSPLLPLLESVANGEPIESESLEWRPAHAVTTVVAAAGYPDAPRKGDPIEIDEPADGAIVFHAGTALDAAGGLVTAGGRVLAVTATGASLADAREASVRTAEGVRFEGRHFRSDIAWRELQRRARAS